MISRSMAATAILGAKILQSSWRPRSGQAVLHILPYDIDSVSGIAVFVRRLARHLQSLGIDNHIISPASLHVEWGNLGLLLWGFVATLRQAQSGTIVHCHQVHPLTAFAAVAGRIRRAPVILTVHLPLTRFASPGSRIAYRMSRAILRGLSQMVVYVSRHSAHTDGNPKGLVVHNGVPTDVFKPSPATRQRARAELGWNVGPLLLFVGRFTTTKGADLVLEASQNARRAGARLLILGPIDPSYVPRLGSPSEVRQVQTERPEDWIPAADVFLLPSQYEGLPLSLLEAMASGVPPVATRVGGIPEVVEDGVSGYLVDENNKNLFLERVSRLLADHKARSSLGEGARERALMFDSAKTYSRYLLLYRSLWRRLE